MRMGEVTGTIPAMPGPRCVEPTCQFFADQHRGCGDLMAGADGAVGGYKKPAALWITPQGRWALGRIRTGDLMIRSSVWIGQRRSLRSRRSLQGALLGGAGCCISLLHRAGGGHRDEEFGRGCGSPALALLCRHQRWSCLPQCLSGLVVVGAVAVWVVVSPPPVTVALLVTRAGALQETRTVRVMGG